MYNYPIGKAVPPPSSGAGGAQGWGPPGGAPPGGAPGGWAPPTNAWGGGSGGWAPPTGAWAPPTGSWAAGGGYPSGGGSYPNAPVGGGGHPPAPGSAYPTSGPGIYPPLPSGYPSGPYPNQPPYQPGAPSVYPPPTDSSIYSPGPGGVQPCPPGGCAYPPGGGAYPPGGNAYPPGGGTYPPGGSAYPPGGSAYPSGGGTYPPGGSAYPPGGSAYPPGGSAYPPGGSAYPSGGNVYPPGGGSYPPSQPNAFPSAPSAPGYPQYPGSNQPYSPSVTPQSTPFAASAQKGNRGSGDEAAIQYFKSFSDKDCIPDEGRMHFLVLAGVDGAIDAFELEGILNKVFLSEFKFDGFSCDMTRSLVAMRDYDISGKLGFEDFRKLWTDLAWCKRAFIMLDVNKSGAFCKTEFSKALQTMGITVPTRVHQALIMRYSDKDGNIRFDDFVLCYIRLKTMMTTYQSKDVQGRGISEFERDEFIQLAIYS